MIEFQKNPISPLFPQWKINFLYFLLHLCLPNSSDSAFSFLLSGSKADKLKMARLLSLESDM